MLNHNLKSGHTVETAPIKSQCSRDYFYTKNPIFEQEFGKLEAENDRLFERMIAIESVPVPASLERRILSGAVMFQEGRTITTVEHANLAWCEAHRVPSITDVQPMHVAGYIEELTRARSAPTAKQRLAAIRHLFDWLVMDQVMPVN